MKQFWMIDKSIWKQWLKTVIKDVNVEAQYDIEQQATILFDEGDYIGEHKDQDSSPDYPATIVFHFSEDYSGGSFVTDEKQSYKPAASTALVNNCSVPHLVTEVESGERLTLACFLSPSFSANKKMRGI